MTPTALEKIFNRSISHCFSKKKALLIFPVLVLCGLLTVVCRIISHGSGQWVQMSLTFLPIFLCSGLLLAVGLVLIRIYYNEVKKNQAPYIKIIKEAKKLFLGIPYLAIPLIFTYLILWMILGIFYLLRSIPQIGSMVGSILSFGPFLLVLGSLVLGFLSLLTLFYITPAAALKSELRPQIAEEVLRDLKANPFLSFIMPLIGLLPVLLLVGVLSLSAVVTEILYVDSGHSLSIALKWFFMMLPFCALLTPAVIFFFNFSIESYLLLRKRIQPQ